MRYYLKLVWRFFMARRNQDPRKAAMRKMMGEFLKENDISLKDGADINSLMREMCLI